jgi:hypothetical protein
VIFILLYPGGRDFDSTELLVCEFEGGGVMVDYLTRARSREEIVEGCAETEGLSGEFFKACCFRR